MNIRMSAREKMFTALCVIAVLFYFFWTILLDPMIRSTSMLRHETSLLKQKIENTRLQAKAVKAVSRSLPAIPSKEQQISTVVDFVDDEFNSNGLKMLSLDQVSSQDRVIIEIAFTGRSGSTIRALNDLTNLKALYIIDSLTGETNQNKFVVKMRISAPYK